MPRIVLFDIGETLLDSEAQMAALAEVHRRVLTDHGFVLTLDEYEQIDKRMIQTFVPSAMHAITWYFAKPDVDLFNRITSQLRSFYPEIRKHPMCLYPGVKQILSELSGKFVLALAANAPGSIRDTLRNFGVLDYFTYTDVSGDMNVKKPDPRFFDRILSRAGVKPDEAVIVGDRLDNDIIPSKSTGMKTIWVRQGRYRGLEPRTPDEIPDETVLSIADVPEALIRLSQKGNSSKNE
jgi:HAD superfamily hydrolase (TIGR01509 family)